MSILHLALAVLVTQASLVLVATAIELDGVLSPVGGFQDFQQSRILLLNKTFVFDGDSPLELEFHLFLGDDLLVALDHFFEQHEGRLVAGRGTLVFDQALRRHCTTSLLDELRETHKYDSVLYFRPEQEDRPRRYLLPAHEPFGTLLELLCSGDNNHHQCFVAMVEETWRELLLVLVLESSRHSGALEQVARSVLADERVDLLVQVPDTNIPTGLGNILLGFVSGLSLHANTRIRDVDYAGLGLYSTVLDERHVARSPFLSPAAGLRDEPGRPFTLQPRDFTTYRLLVLHDEVPLFAPEMVSSQPLPLKTLRDPLLATLFARNVSINAEFDRARIPTPVARRLLRAVRAVRFRPHVQARAAEVVDSLVAPSLGVSVRSYAAAHERGFAQLDDSAQLRYSPRLYQQAVERLLRQPTSPGPGPPFRSLLLAFDSPELLPEFEPWLDELRRDHPQLQVFLFSDFDRPGALPLHGLEKAAVELLALSKTTHLCGYMGSSFLNAVFLFGEFRQTVFNISAV